MVISGSLWRKALVTVIAAVAFVSLLEVTMLDSQNLPWLRPGVANDVSSAPAPGARLTVSATALKRRKGSSGKRRNWMPSSAVGAAG